MTAGARPQPLIATDADGAAAPPRRNGELVFDAPWESRAFGLAMAMAENGTFEFEDLRGLLIDEIATWERAHPDGDDAEWSYYERWLAALERLVIARDLLTSDEVDARISRIAVEQAHEHDHDHHDHDHDHDHLPETA